MTTISSDFTKTQHVKDDGDSLTVAKGVDGIVDGTVIDAGTVADFRSIIVKGHLEANGDADLSPDAINLGVDGDSSGSNGNVITVAESGSLEAVDSGIEAYGVGTDITNEGSIKAAYGIRGDLNLAFIVNKGTINATTIGADLHGGSIEFDNSGTLKSSGSYALQMSDDINVVTNDGSITAKNGIAVHFQSEEDEVNYFQNDGTISGKATAFEGADGDETIKNYGAISGDVILGDGVNIFINKKGTVDGTVYGGNDLDSYTIQGTAFAISEDKGGSKLDHIFSNISMTLPKNVEILSLSGDDDINGTGNSNENSIFGNSGANTLKGGGGSDYLASDAGKDLLYGGDGADIFYFDDGYDKDTIKDFEDGLDKIALYDHSATPDYDSVKEHMSQDGDNVVIDFGDGDKLTINNITVKHLTEADFVDL